MHGIFDDYTSMNELVQYIERAHPGTDVYNIDAFNDLVSECKCYYVFIPFLTIYNRKVFSTCGIRHTEFRKRLLQSLPTQLME